jgi:hypothetical protein
MYILLNTSSEVQHAQQFLKVLHYTVLCVRDTAGMEMTRFDSSLFPFIRCCHKGSVPLKLGCLYTLLWFGNMCLLDVT